jgi:hypothetical protein
MHCSVLEFDDGTIGYTDLTENTEFIAMTGKGGIVTPGNIEYEIAKRMIDGTSRSIAKNYVEGLAHGGLTAVQANNYRAAIARANQENQGRVVLQEKRVEDTTIPSHHRMFRDAWCWHDKIEVDMPKARLIHMDRIRGTRNNLLNDSDVTFRKAMEKWIRTETPEARSEAIRLADEAQVLRDIPQTFDLIVYTTPEELHAAWPLELT